MFVRWKDNGGGKLSAVLVKSVRVNGLPRQKTVRYLSSIRHRYFIADQGCRLDFWDRLRGNLWLSRQEGEIDEKQQKAIERKIMQTVPLPTKKYLGQRAEEGDLSHGWGYDIPLERCIKAIMHKKFARRR